MKRVLLFAILSFMVCFSATAQDEIQMIDVITLRGGEQIKGWIINYEPNRLIKIKTVNNQLLEIPFSTVDNIGAQEYVPKPQPQPQPQKKKGFDASRVFISASISGIGQAGDLPVKINHDVEYDAQGNDTYVSSEAMGVRINVAGGYFLTENFSLFAKYFRSSIASDDTHEWGGFVKRWKYSGFMAGPMILIKPGIGIYSFYSSFGVARMTNFRIESKNTFAFSVGANYSLLFSDHFGVYCGLDFMHFKPTILNQKVNVSDIGFSGGLFYRF